MDSIQQRIAKLEGVFAQKRLQKEKTIEQAQILFGTEEMDEIRSRIAEINEVDSQIKELRSTFDPLLDSSVSLLERGQSVPSETIEKIKSATESIGLLIRKRNLLFSAEGLKTLRDKHPELTRNVS